MRERLYDDNLYRFNEPQQSYWEATANDIAVTAPQLKSDEACDVAVIGGGYTGLSTALHLARDYNIDVRVLDAGHFGWGASGRNGGFCCIGGTGVSLQDLIKLVGLESAKEYYRHQVDAVNLVREIAGEEGLDLQSHGNAELVVAHSKKAFKRLEDEHDLQRNELGLECELLSSDEFGERHYESTEQFGALISRPAFGLHPLRYCRGLASAASIRGVKLHEHSEVLQWSKSSDGWHQISTDGGTLSAKKVVFSTNGFMPERLRAEFYARTLPVVSAILVTRPLSADERAAHQWVSEDMAINSRRIMNYFRMLPDNRFLFGGRGHSKGDVKGEKETYQRLQSMLGALWPAWSEVEIDYQWHGLICMTGSLCPSLGQLDGDKSVFFGYGYHGNGVNTATWTGKQIADWIGNGAAPELPAIVRGLAKKFPLARLRRRYLQLAIGVSSYLDRRG